MKPRTAVHCDYCENAFLCTCGCEMTIHRSGCLGEDVNMFETIYRKFRDDVSLPRDERTALINALDEIYDNEPDMKDRLLQTRKRHEWRALGYQV